MTGTLLVDRYDEIMIVFGLERFSHMVLHLDWRDRHRSVRTGYLFSLTDSTVLWEPTDDVR